MRRINRFKLVFIILALGIQCLVLQAFAADDKWPTRPITILVPYNAGGGMDMMSRILSETMKKTLGVAMPVLNMQGAVGAIGTDHVYKQPRDGYTLYALSSGICTFPATGFSNYTYKEFGVIGICFEALPVYTVAFDSPIKNMNQLIDGLKKGNLTGSNTGRGGIWHVPQVIMNSCVGGNFKVVPFNSGTDSALAAAKKEVDFATCDIAEAQVYIREKMLRPLCVVDDKQFQLEGVGVIPPVTEFVPNIKDRLMAAKGWRALGYARGIPEDRIKKLIQAFRVAVESDEVKNFSKKSLLSINGLTGSEADKVFAGTTQILSWLLYDLKEGKRSPDELGIPRYGK